MVEPLFGEDDCIYLACAGNAYMHQAELCVWSLREEGRFNGDILVFTTPGQKYNTRLGNWAEVIEVDLGDQINWYVGRIHALKHRDMTCYKRIMYLDSDILATSSLQPMFDSYAPGKFNYVVGNGKVSSWKLMHTFFSSKQMKEHGDKSMINSGTYIIDNDVDLTLFDHWLDAYESEVSNESKGRKRFRCDQPVLNRIIYDQEIECNQLTKGYVSFHRHMPPTDITCLVHYVGFKDPWTALVHMKGDRI